MHPANFRLRPETVMTVTAERERPIDDKPLRMAVQQRTKILKTQHVTLRPAIRAAHC